MVFQAAMVRSFPVAVPSPGATSLTPPACFTALPSNLGALDATLSFASGRRPFVVVCGASGWGKSHLLRNAAEFARAAGHSVGLMSADTWLSSSKQASTQPEMLVLDDVHLVAQRPRRRQQLFRELERRVRAGKPTLCALGSREVSLRGLLPNPRQWLQVHVEDPCEEDRTAVVLQMCEALGLEVSADQAFVVAKLVRGDGHSLLGALSRLTAACSGRKVRDLHPVRLAGMLYPYSVDHADLRDLVMEAVVKVSNGCSDASKWAAICVYILERLAGLSEEAIASYFGMKPGDVYRIRRDVQKRLAAKEPDLDSYLDRVLSHVAIRLREN